MKAEELLCLLSGVRSRGTDQWIAQCPSHEDRHPSLTIRQTSDRILIYCWANCPTDEICIAIGIELADLFDDDHRRRRRPDSEVLRRQRAYEALEQWRQEEIRRIAENLRQRDTIIRGIDSAVQEGRITEDEAWTSLAHEYDGYSDLEYKLDRLNRNEDTLVLWRESRAV